MSKSYKPRERPEAKIQKAIIKMLKKKGWWVKVMSASMYQTGIPDLIASHRVFGPRFIEVKLPNMKGSRFTQAQLETFPEICSHGFGVWILTSDSDAEYQKLKQKPNWYKYLKIMKA